MTKLVALILFSSVMLSGYSQSRTVELPLTMRDGYGPFKPGFGGLSPDTDDSNSPWHKSTPKIQRLPEGLTEVNSGTVDTNIHQHVYQNYLAGNITKEWYDNLQKSWNWTPDKTTLSNSPVRTKIAFAYGLDAEGVTRFVLDTNGNLDLSDDPLLTPLDMASIDGVTNKDSLAMVHGVRCVVETFVHNRVVPVEVPVFVTWMERLQMYFSNISCHATTEYKGQKIAV